MAFHHAGMALVALTLNSPPPLPVLSPLCSPLVPALAVGCPALRLRLASLVLVRAAISVRSGESRHSTPALTLLSYPRLDPTRPFARPWAPDHLAIFASKVLGPPGPAWRGHPAGGWAIWLSTTALTEAGPLRPCHPPTRPIFTGPPSCLLAGARRMLTSSLVLHARTAPLPWPAALPLHHLATPRTGLPAPSTPLALSTALCSLDSLPVDGLNLRASAQ